MKEKIMRRFIVISFRMSQFGAAILFVWGVIGFTDGPISWESHNMYALQVMLGYYLMHTRYIQDVIDEFNPKNGGVDGLDTTAPVRSE